jgi:hypothetical protein
MEFDQIKNSLTTMLQMPVNSLERLGGGRNSCVYKVGCPENMEFTAKVYFHSKTDTRNRQKTEFDGLRFIREAGITNVPRPMAASKDLGITIFEYVQGEPVQSCQLDETDIHQASKFLLDLYEASKCRSSEKLPGASEAFFSLDTILNNIKSRLSRLEQIEPHRGYMAFRDFLHHELIPAFKTVEAWVRKTAEACFIEAYDEIPTKDRTLSPSDFGFHNAIKRPDGLIVFIDFEYFGWDDPAKMISDFLLHPAMSMPNKFRRQFVKSIVQKLGSEALLNRTKTVYPLFGLKWSLILLNEFLPDQLTRREFAENMTVDRNTLQDQQLEKARIMLKRVLKEYDNFADYYYC